MLSCKQATRLASDARERELSPNEKIQFKLHLMICKACRNFNRNVGGLHKLMQDFAKNKDD